MAQNGLVGIPMEADLTWVLRVSRKIRWAAL